MRLLRRAEGSGGKATATVSPGSAAAGAACRQCGTPATGSVCRRCGLPVGAPPRKDVELPSCHVCYRSVDDDGLLPSLDRPSQRIDLLNHLEEHDRHPVGDDEWLESLRTGDRIRIGRWSAPFDVVRRYLVTGSLDGGRRREYEHNAIVSAMTQIKRWGPDAGAKIFGDQPEWQAARAAVTDLMDRYHRGR